MSWALALGIAILAGVFIALVGTNESGTDSPVSLPPSAESAHVAAAQAQFPGAGETPAILVVIRDDGAALNPDDLTAASAARDRTLAAAKSASSPPVLIPAPDGKAVIATVPLSANLTGF